MVFALRGGERSEFEAFRSFILNSLFVVLFSLGRRAVFFLYSSVFQVIVICTLNR